MNGDTIETYSEYKYPRSMISEEANSRRNIDSRIREGKHDAKDLIMSGDQNKYITPQKTDLEHTGENHNDIRVSNLGN